MAIFLPHSREEVVVSRDFLINRKKRGWNGTFSQLHSSGKAEERMSERRVSAASGEQKYRMLWCESSDRKTLGTVSVFP